MAALTGLTGVAMIAAMTWHRSKIAGIAVALAVLTACTPPPPRDDFVISVDGRAFRFFVHPVPAGSWRVPSTGQSLTIPENAYTVYLDPANPTAVAAHKVEPLLGRRTADAAMRHVCGPDRVARLLPSFLLQEPTFTCEAATAAR